MDRLYLWKKLIRQGMLCQRLVKINYKRRAPAQKVVRLYDFLISYHSFWYITEYRQMRKSVLIMTMIPILLLFAALSANGADWQYFGSDKNGNSLFYDIKNIAYSDNVIKVYQKENHREEFLARLRNRLGDDYDDLTEIVNLIEIDCPHEQSRIRSVSYYSSSGKELKNIKSRGGDWQDIPQESPIHMLYELSCPANWEYFISSNDDKYFLNTGRMILNDLTVTFWMKAINKKTEKETEKTKFTIKCKNGNYAVRYQMKYKPDGSAPAVYSEGNFVGWDKIPSDTIIDSFQKLLCVEGAPRKDVGGYLKDTFHKDKKLPGVSASQ
jgi:hypothetical protein